MEFNQALGNTETQTGAFILAHKSKINLHKLFENLPEIIPSYSYPGICYTYLHKKRLHTMGSVIIRGMSRDDNSPCVSELDGIR